MILFFIVYHIRGVARIFKMGVDFLLKRAKQGASEASVAYIGGFQVEAPENIPFPWIWKPQIARNWHPECIFFLSEFFQYNDDFYGDLYGD